jgi:predicted metal-binding membrane protein
VSDATGLERLLRRDRVITGGGLGVLLLLAWLYLLAGAGMGMSAWDMTTLALFPHKAGELMAGMAMPAAGEAGGMRASGWTAGGWALAVAMWWIMMAAMMAPSAAPTILLYARVHRHASPRQPGLAPTAPFAAGYLVAWLGFALAAAGLQWSAQRLGWVSPATMSSQSRWFSAAVLTATGLYQLTPLKQACLNHCRSPAAFLSRYWRPGLTGALGLGVRHGAYCVGCCWMLMALLFVGGVMNLAWIAVLAALVLVEKLTAGGRRLGMAAGALLVCWGVATVFV